MEAICAKFESDHLPYPTEQMWKQSTQGFKEKWGFPNCCGSIDGKHIRIQAPSQSGSLYYNYKGYFSIVLLAIVDPNYKFVAVDIGTCGSISDGGVLARSAIWSKLENGGFNLPDLERIGEVQLPAVFVGDDAFPLRPNILKPYSGRKLTYEQRIFNYRLSRARMVVECAFGILSSRWRILHTAINADLSLAKLIVKTCVVLHNYLISQRDTVNEPARDDNTSYATNQNGLHSLSHQGSNNYSNNASNVREEFTVYFNTIGKLPWQDNMI